MAIDEQYSQKHRRSPSRDRDMSSKRHKHRHDDLEEGEILDDDDDRSIPQSHQPNLVCSRTFLILLILLLFRFASEKLVEFDWAFYELIVFGESLFVRVAELNQLL